MTVAELIRKLTEYAPGLPVYLRNGAYGEHSPVCRIRSHMVCETDSRVYDGCRAIRDENECEGDEKAGDPFEALLI